VQIEGGLAGSTVTTVVVTRSTENLLTGVFFMARLIIVALLIIGALLLWRAWRNRK